MVWPVPAMMTADVMRAVPAVVTAHAVMRAIAVIVVMTILNFGRQLLAGAALNRCRDAWAVQRSGVRLLRWRCDEQQSCDSSEAKNFLYVHVSSPQVCAHLNMHAANGSSPMLMTLGFGR